MNKQNVENLLSSLYEKNRLDNTKFNGVEKIQKLLDCKEELCILTLSANPKIAKEMYNEYNRKSSIDTSLMIKLNGDKYGIAVKKSDIREIMNVTKQYVAEKIKASQNKVKNTIQR